MLESPVAVQSPHRELGVGVKCLLAADRAIYGIARHWLAFVNLISFGVVAGILIAPLLVASGHAGAAAPIYRFFGLFCHQRDERSFHIAGQKMACCERCFAIYTSILVAGLVVALLRR